MNRAAALELSAKAHAGQKDKGGKSYILHPLRVARAVDAAGLDEDHVVVALLHDVVEDTPVTLDDLRAAGFSERVIDAVDAITQRKREKAPSYYTRVIANDVARAVKRFDVADNSSEDRMALLPQETQDRLRKKYARALAALDSGVYEDLGS